MSGKFVSIRYNWQSKLCETSIENNLKNKKRRDSLDSRVELASIIFYSKSLRGFTAVIRSAMSINEIFIHPRYALER